MQTTLHRYCFDIREPAGEAAWRKLKARLTAGRFCFGWRSDGLDPEAVAALVTTGAEFRWPYDIKCPESPINNATQR